MDISIKKRNYYITEYIFDDSLKFSTSVISVKSKTTEYTRKKDVGKSTISLFGIFPLFQVNNTINEVVTHTKYKYHVKLTDEMKEIQKRISQLYEFEDKKIIFSDVIIRKNLNKDDIIDVNPVVNEFNGIYIINWV